MRQQVNRRLENLAKRIGTTSNRHEIAAQVARGLILAYGDPSDDSEELAGQIMSGDFNRSIEKSYSQQEV